MNKKEEEKDDDNRLLKQVILEFVGILILLIQIKVDDL